MQVIHRFAAALAVSAVAVLGAAAPALAAAPARDTSFGTDPGDPGTTAQSPQYTTDVARQPSGDYLVLDHPAGSSTTIVTRLTAAGAVDPSFNTVTAAAAPSGYDYRIAGGFAVVPSGATSATAGSFYVAELLEPSSGSGNNWKLVVNRYQPDGQIDTTYGGPSITLPADDTGSVTGTRVALQPDGGVIVAATMNVNSSSSNEGLLVRFAPGQPGTVDSSFGAGGIDRFTDNGGTEFSDLAATDTRIIVSGVGSGTDALFGFDPSGQPLSGFGTNGVVALPAGLDPADSRIDVLSDNSILLGGSAYTSGGAYEGYLARFTSAGAAAWGAPAVFTVPGSDYLHPGAVGVSGGDAVLIADREPTLQADAVMIDAADAGTGTPDASVGTGGEYLDTAPTLFNVESGLVDPSDGTLVAVGSTEATPITGYVRRYTFGAAAGGGEAVRTAVFCNPASLALAGGVLIGGNATCNAVVQGSSGTGAAPTGTVTFTSSNGSGTFPGGATCTLTPVSGTPDDAGCAADVTYAPNQLVHVGDASETDTISAGYGGDTTHSAGTGSQQLGVYGRPVSVQFTGCSPALVLGRSTTCSATVTDVAAGAKSSPAGDVALTDGGRGAGGCLLAAGANGVSSCAVRFAPNDTKATTHSLKAVYEPSDRIHSPASSDAVTVTSGKAAATLFSLTGSAPQVGSEAIDASYEDATVCLLQITKTTPHGQDAVTLTGEPAATISSPYGRAFPCPAGRLDFTLTGLDADTDYLVGLHVYTDAALSGKAPHQTLDTGAVSSSKSFTFHTGAVGGATGQHGGVVVTPVQGNPGDQINVGVQLPVTFQVGTGCSETIYPTGKQTFNPAGCGATGGIQPKLRRSGSVILARARSLQIGQVTVRVRGHGKRVLRIRVRPAKRFRNVFKAKPRKPVFVTAKVTITIKPKHGHVRRVVQKVKLPL